MQQPSQPSTPVGSTQARFADRGVPPLTYFGRWFDQPPVWAEGRAAIEYGRLLRSPVFSGERVIHGGDRPVLLVPGFLAGDSSLGVMRDWLLRCGYHADVAGIKFNVRYSELVMRQLTQRLVSLHRGLGVKVIVIGHSRGGMLGKVLGHRYPQMVDKVVTLGSPLNDPYDVHPLTMAGVHLAHAYNTVRYARTARVESRFMRDLHETARVPVFSIYSRSDGIVHWEACLRPDAECIEVSGSHVGMGVNPAAYEAIGRLLPLRGRPNGRTQH